MAHTSSSFDCDLQILLLKQVCEAKEQRVLSERGELGYRRNLVPFFKGGPLNFSSQQDYTLQKVGSNLEDLQYWKSEYLQALFPWGEEQVFIKGTMFIPRS